MRLDDGDRRRQQGPIHVSCGNAQQDEEHHPAPPMHAAAAARHGRTAARPQRRGRRIGSAAPLRKLFRALLWSRFDQRQRPGTPVLLSLDRGQNLPRQYTATRLNAQHGPSEVAPSLTTINGTRKRPQPLAAQVRPGSSARSASRRRGRAHRDGGSCRSACRIALRRSRSPARSGGCGAPVPRNPR